MLFDILSTFSCVNANRFGSHLKNALEHLHNNLISICEGEIKLFSKNKILNNKFKVVQRWNQQGKSEHSIVRVDEGQPGKSPSFIETTRSRKYSNCPIKNINQIK